VDIFELRTFMAATLMTTDNLLELTSQISVNSLTPPMAIAPSPVACG
jgi:hypothetical protein